MLILKKKTYNSDECKKGEQARLFHEYCLIKVEKNKKPTKMNLFGKITSIISLEQNLTGIETRSQILNSTIGF